jgi:hypothetical protein
MNDIIRGLATPGSELEIPCQLYQCVESWDRTLSNAQPEAAPVVLKNAALELRKLAGSNIELRRWVDARLTDMSAHAGLALCDADQQDVAESLDGWSSPVRIKAALPPVEPFIPEMVPEVIRDFVFDVADRQQCPPDFVAISAMCAVAAMVGNAVRICPKQHDDWTVVPNLWGAIIGRPSAMKSPAMQAALQPLFALEDDLRANWEESVKAADIDAAVSKLEAKEAEARARKELKSGNRDGAREIVAAFDSETAQNVPCPRVAVNDATVEKLGELLNENPRGLLLKRDELPGFLAQMEDESFAATRAFFLEAYNGDGQFTYDRIGRGTVHIKHATISLIGGVQPARIAPLVRGAISGASNDGLIQRLQLATYPDDNHTWKYVDRKPNALARSAYERMLRELYELGFDHADAPLVLRFSPAAQELFVNWMCHIQAQAHSGKLSSVLESHLLKMPKTVASLALLFELIGGGRSHVDVEGTLMALGWAEYLWSHAVRLYAASDAAAEDGARLILERRHQLPHPFRARDIHQKGWAGLADHTAVTAAIDVLVRTHHCREFDCKPSALGGRPTTSFCWNPALGRRR